MNNSSYNSPRETISIENVIESKGYLVYTNLGFSMMPLLRQKKDIIEIHKKGSGRCKKYDVVLYKRGNKYILHRILKVLPEGYIIAGDHNTFVESDVTDDIILGVMTRIIRNGKSITPDNFWYKVYVHLWCDCYPVRMWIIRTKQRVWSILSRIKHKVFK